MRLCTILLITLDVPVFLVSCPVRLDMFIILIHRLSHPIIGDMTIYHFSQQHH